MTTSARPTHPLFGRRGGACPSRWYAVSFLCRSADLLRAPWLPLGEAVCGASLRRLMRVGEQLHFAEHAKLCVSAPRPSSGSLRSPPVPTLFVPSGHFPLIGGIGPEGKARGAHRPAAACKSHSCPPAGGVSPSPTLRRNLGYVQKTKRPGFGPGAFCYLKFKPASVRRCRCRPVRWTGSRLLRSWCFHHRRGCWRGQNRGKCRR